MASAPLLSASASSDPRRHSPRTAPSTPRPVPPSSRTSGVAPLAAAALACLLCAAPHAGCVAPPAASADKSAASNLDDIIGESEQATWTCTGSPCPWGASLSDHVIAWPATAAPVAARLGYTASPAAYLPADSANGLTLSIEAGTASVFAGDPMASSHRFLAAVSSGQSYLVSGLEAGEVLSVQSEASFSYRVTPPSAPTDPGDPPSTSQTVTWTCTGSPCPWGNSLSGEALVWPTDAGAVTGRLGYTVSAGVYLPAGRANGADIAIDSGAASAYAGLPDDSSHRWLADIAAGQSLHVTGLSDGEVLSVQSSSPFGYHASLPVTNPTPDPPPGAIASIAAFWRCNAPDCHGDPWTGAVINWPDWSAYQSNARAGDQARAVFAADDTPLYPYMGAWAQGCEVTAVTGTVLIIEWQRGTDTWRATGLQPGQSHVINLVPPEDGAMIETYDGMPGFSVTLNNCTPQPLAP